MYLIYIAVIYVSSILSSQVNSSVLKSPHIYTFVELQMYQHQGKDTRILKVFSSLNDSAICPLVFEPFFPFFLTAILNLELSIGKVLFCHTFVLDSHCGFSYVTKATTCLIFFRDTFKMWLQMFDVFLTPYLLNPRCKGMNWHDICRSSLRFTWGWWLRVFRISV